MVFGVAFGVPLLCCILAALLSFLVCVSLITYKRFFGVRQASPVALTSSPNQPAEEYDAQLLLRLLVSPC